MASSDALGPVVVSAADLDDAQADRYHRQRLIPWWDQKRVEHAKVLLVGAGALGNEVLKLLALLGVGNTLVVDMDVIETSNLSRAVLFRREDVGEHKAPCIARHALELNPDVRVHALPIDVLLSAGLGLFLWADVVIGALDNREARVFLNAACAKTRRVWVDGAIESLSGIVRVFDPCRGPCYECTMNATDRALLAERRSCTQLAREAVQHGHVPSTAVAASIVAGWQVQEAIKFLHGQPALTGRGLHIDGLSAGVENVAYPRRDDCPGHDEIPTFEALPSASSDLTVEDLLDLAETRVGSGAVLDLSRDIILSLACLDCGTSEPVYRALGAVRASDAACPACGAHRALEFTSFVERSMSNLLSLRISALGLPRFDVVVARRGLGPRVGFLLSGDAPDMLGPLLDSYDPNLDLLPRTSHERT